MPSSNRPTAFTGAPKAYTVSVAGQYLERNPGRQSLRIFNSGANALQVEFGGAPLPGSRTIAAGGELDLQSPPGDALWLVSVGGSTTVQIWST